MKLNKQERHQQLAETIQQTPFVTDEDLAKQFGVSIQTIRLDRMELNIPELRKRIKDVAEQQFDEVKALQEDEVIGSIIDLQLDQSAISLLEIQTEHVFSRTGIARGHHLFAQANSLAVAVINDELALTSDVKLKFIRQVKSGERVIAKATVTQVGKGRTAVEVNSFSGEEHVFKGTFTMYRSNLEGRDVE
ncbi:transcription factor FapR [Tuberibacillus sp. Marseille-P3662]|uniref:transcription factor FapR n=1 Tax=Tuberibacillus sp. Marseille-P3662 TaxID=1965358 RepID=UPI000A1CDF3E|nr:transcription factor FapR [Tuberibacillus sp. Marseille-P3662]